MFALFIIPVLMLIALLSIPYLNYQSNTAGVWFASANGRRMAIVAAACAVIITPIGIDADEFIINFTTWMPGVPSEISSGLIPFMLMLIAVAGFYFFVKKKFAATNNEALQAVFVLFVVAFIILTITCIWFRGSGMALMWPWEI